MTDQPDIVAEATEYCERKGMALTTLGLKALKNPRWFERMEKWPKWRAEQERRNIIHEAKLAEQAAQLRQWMADNPPENQ